MESGGRLALGVGLGRSTCCVAKLAQSVSKPSCQSPSRLIAVPKGAHACSLDLELPKLPSSLTASQLELGRADACMVPALLAEQRVPKAPQHLITVLVHASIAHGYELPVSVDDTKCQVVERVGSSLSAALAGCRRNFGTRTLCAKMCDRVTEPLVTEVHGHLDAACGESADGARTVQ